MQSDLLTSGSWIRHGSIPSLELLSFSIALEKNNTLLHNHQSTLFTEKNCNIHFILDSTCALYSLCPSKISKSILQRDVKSQTMTVLTQLSTSYPNPEIYLCHVPTSMMIADLATKRPPAIVEALNSTEWRHASSTKLFTKPTDIFMIVNNGKITWLKNENNPSHCMKCLNVNCGQAISLNLQFEFQIGRAHV